MKREIERLIEEEIKRYEYTLRTLEFVSDDEKEYPSAYFKVRLILEYLYELQPKIRGIIDNENS